MNIRLAARLQEESIVDGPGLRAVIWTQGCNHHCPGCHNPQTWRFEGGALFSVADINHAIGKLKYHDGITFSGGDPIYQAAACYEIAKYAKNKNLNIWCYTGFKYEELIAMNNKDINNFLSVIDVLVDGRFVMAERSLDLLFRGSSNQRLIDMKETRKQGKVILFNEEEYLNGN
jgi:anaerobic ribonucleoside-triphosphate reductase activating protein